MPPTLQALRHIPVSNLRLEDVPITRIRTDADVETWKRTTGYQDYGLFIRRLAESVVGYNLPYTPPESDRSEAISAMISTLDTLDKWIDEIPPQPTPQRFGNLAFRTWGKRLETEAPELLKSLLPSGLHGAVPHLEPYFVTGFGHFTRMDYGTGHETSFGLFLLGLTLIRFFEPEPHVERQLVLSVFVRYMDLVHRLQDVYKLEPAGSHGVWGLDDYCFLSYLFGSAQLRDQTEIPVSAVLRTPLPPTNLYFISINRVHEVKSGPFHEHSSQLHSVATNVMTWSKVNSGLFKMYEAEVLGKRVVVQHIPLGGLLSWDTAGAPSRTPNAPLPEPASIAPTSESLLLPGVATAAPSNPKIHPAQPGFRSWIHSTQDLGDFNSFQQNPIVPGRMALGPTASTAHRPMPAPAPAAGGAMAPPPPPSGTASGGAAGQP